MEESNNVRYRSRGSKPNGVIKQRDEIVPDPQFTHRESPLTVLIKNSLHMRAIYHIFVVILLVLLFDTVVYDLVERGKINIGISTVAYGFGDIGRGAKLWFYELFVALAFYPGLKFYIAGARLFKTHTGLRRVWQALGIAGLLALQTALVAVPVWDLGRKHLALASAVAVTCEMEKEEWVPKLKDNTGIRDKITYIIRTASSLYRNLYSYPNFRFAMKIHATTVACAPRWQAGRPPLPTFTHYLYYLFAPTLLYRDQYPRTQKTRWGLVIFNFMEVAAVIFYNSFLWERFILPYWSEYGKESKVEAGTVVRGMFACVLPGVISFLCGFYVLLHAWMNAFAEMLRFADRLFYDEWWTTSQFSKYYRAWNRVVHCWLRDHIYKPLIPRTGRHFAVFAVFFVSAAVHEVILALSFGYFYPVLMMQFGVLGVLLVPITATSGRRFPSVMNLLMWLSFFIGNGILWSLYPMEYFARKNCPPSEHDSFFIPKSWTCPEIVLKPNWTFQNPF